MTTITSDSPISSSRSADTSRVARPWARASRMSSHTAAWAPTSMPRVGWLAMSTAGPATISRPTISFCWLPPDRAWAATSMPGVRTSKPSATSAARPFIPARLSHGPRE